GTVVWPTGPGGGACPCARRNGASHRPGFSRGSGPFGGPRRFQTSTGIEHFLDAKQLRTGPADTDIFFYDRAATVIGDARAHGPVFVFVYLAVNHFPWDFHYRPDLLPDWGNPGNPFDIDEYLRRQPISANDYP